MPLGRHLPPLSVAFLFRSLAAEAEEKARRDDPLDHTRLTDPLINCVPRPIRDDFPAPAAIITPAAEDPATASEIPAPAAAAAAADPSTNNANSSKPLASGGGCYKRLPPPIVTEPAPRPPDLNHFYHRDLTLPLSLQDPRSYSPPPPDEAELARRNLRFKRMNHFRR